MSSYLWRYYLEDDVESFRRLLANASYSTGGTNTQRLKNLSGSFGTPTFNVGSPTVPLGSSPKTTPRQKGKAQGHSQPLTLTRSDINSRDSIGLTILHHAASSTDPSAIDFALALLEAPLIDLYIQDLENGWTALHRALYFGNITVARSMMTRDIHDATTFTSNVGSHAGGLIKIKDKEGNSPFDVYGATIASRNIKSLPFFIDDSEVGGEESGVEHSLDDSGTGTQMAQNLLKSMVCIGGDEVYTFGSNKNLTLGLGDEDNRQYPERITLSRPEHLLRSFWLESLNDNSGLDPERSLSDIPAVIRNRPVVIRNVHMSKLSTAVITDDPYSNLYMCGFGPGGRLGTGDEITRFRFVCIEDSAIAGKKIMDVALGQNHTLAVSGLGEVFSFGMNSFGQLGYSLPKSSIKGDQPVQSLPRQIFGPLKKEFVTGIAASSIHSVVHTLTALYTFGKNEGQLGLVDSDAASLEIQTTPRRVGASRFSSGIQAVSAIDRATCCLLESHEVWVFSHFLYIRLSFPLGGFTNFFLNIRIRDTPVNCITKITSGGNTICAMSSWGEVFTVNVNQKSDSGSSAGSTTNPNKTRNVISQPYKAWSIKKDHMAVRDVDVGQDGSIIICTESGSVWRRVQRAKIKDTPSSGRINYKPKDYKFSRVPSLTRAVAVRSNAFGAFAAVRKDFDVTNDQIDVTPPGLWNDISSLLPFRGLRPEKEASDIENPTPGLGTIRMAALESVDLEKDVDALLKELKPGNNSYDVWVKSSVSDVRIPIHEFMITGRSSVLQKAFVEFRQSYYYEVPDVFHLEYDKGGQTQLVFQGVDFLTTFNWVFYIYADTFVDYWHYTRRVPEYAFRYRQVRVELIKIAAQLEMFGLEHAARLMNEPSKTLHKDMEQAIQRDGYFNSADTVIDLDGGEAKVHSAFVCQRCPFFEGLFNGRTGGRWLSSRRGEKGETTPLVRVDLKHIEPDIFNLVLRYLYADTGEELFDHLTDNDLDDFLDIVLEVMGVANELMLDRLAQICQRVLGRYVNIRNVCSLVNAVAPCSVTEFKNAALEYICLNLEAMLENQLLDELDDDLLFELDEVIRQNQLTCLPFAKSGQAEAELMQCHPELAELLDQSRRRKIDSMALRSHLHEDEAKFSSSIKAKIGSYDGVSTSPSAQKAQRRGSMQIPTTHSSPSLKPKFSSSDLLFDMDEDGLKPESTVDLDFQGESARDRRKSSSTAIDEVAEEQHYDQGDSLSTANFSETQEKQSSHPKAPISAAAANPWGSSPLQTGKLEMKDIMAQAASNRVSGISSGLSKPAGTFGGKLSQKERKKQLQHQQEAQPSTSAIKTPIKSATSSASQSKTSPWQTAPAGPKISLKDVLQRPPTPPAPAHSLTMRQTIPGNITPRKKPAPDPQSQSQSQSKPSSTPGPSSHSHPHPHPSPSLHLSMADILAQQQTEKEILKEAVAKRSLQDIQQEQEFQEWWDAESRKIMAEEAAASSSVNVGGGGDVSGRGGGGGGGGSKRGRHRNRDRERSDGKGGGGSGSGARGGRGRGRGSGRGRGEGRTSRGGGGGRGRGDSAAASTTTAGNKSKT
ncbi:MAG: hypothetical protein M1834_008531 [Cirrosporium novae-zelandiae]|nr:MAG: hypothetical protein M1834_008531 [Cirrosporium novae-zelandiae]